MNIKLSDLGAAPTTVVGTYRDVQSAGQIGRAVAQLGEVVGQIAERKREQNEAYISQRLQDVVQQQQKDAQEAYAKLKDDPNEMVNQAVVFDVTLNDLKNEAKERGVSHAFMGMLNDRITSIGNLAWSDAKLKTDQWGIEITAKAGQEMLNNGPVANGTFDSSELYWVNRVKAIRQDLSPDEQAALIYSMNIDSRTNRFTGALNGVSTVSECDDLGQQAQDDSVLTADAKRRVLTEVNVQRNRILSAQNQEYATALQNATFDVGLLASGYATSEQKKTLAAQFRNASEAMIEAKTQEERLSVVQKYFPDLDSGLHEELAATRDKDLAHFGVTIQTSAEAQAKVETRSAAKVPVEGMNDIQFSKIKQAVETGQISDQEAIIRGTIHGEKDEDGKYHILNSTQESDLFASIMQGYKNQMESLNVHRKERWARDILQFLTPDFQNGEYLMDSRRFRDFYLALQGVKGAQGGNIVERDLLGYAIDTMSAGTARNYQDRGFLGIGNGVDPEKSREIGRAMAAIRDQMPRMSDMAIRDAVIGAIQDIENTFSTLPSGTSRQTKLDSIIEGLGKSTAKSVVSDALSNVPD